MAPHTKIPVPSSAPLQRRHSSTVDKNQVSESASGPACHRVSKSNPAATHMAEAPQQSTLTRSVPRPNNKSHHSASSKALPRITTKSHRSTSTKSLESGTTKSHPSALSKTPPRITNEPHHFGPSKSLPWPTNKPDPSAPSPPLTKYTTFRRQKPTLVTPIRGTVHTLLALDANFARNVQAWIYGHVEDVTCKLKDEKRFEYHLHLEPDEERVEVTEGMRRDLMDWIDTDDEEGGVTAEMRSDLMAYMDANDEEESAMKIVVTPNSPDKMTSITATEIEATKTIKTGDIKLETIRAKTTEEMRSDLVSWIEEDDEGIEEGGIRIVVTSASPAKMMTITTAEYEASKAIKSDSREKSGLVAGSSAQDEPVNPCAQTIARKIVPAPLFRLKAKVATPVAQQARLRLRRTSPSLAALMAIAHDSDDDGERASDDDDDECDSLAEFQRKIGGEEANNAVVSGSPANHPTGTRHTLPGSAYGAGRLGTKTFENTLHTSPHIIHICYTSTNDALTDISSTRTSVFSKQPSLTTRSSRASMNTADGNYSRLIDALALEVDVNGLRKGAATDRGSSLSNDSSLNSESDGIDDQIDGLHNSLEDLLRVNQDFECLVTSPIVQFTASTSASTANLPSLYRVHADQDIENGQVTNAAEAEALRKPSRGHRWLGGLKRQVKKVPCKACEVVKSTKRFTRTLLGFVPAAMAARNPFEGL